MALKLPQWHCIGPIQSNKTRPNTLTGCIASASAHAQRACPIGPLEVYRMLM